MSHHLHCSVYNAEVMCGWWHVYMSTTAIRAHLRLGIHKSKSAPSSCNFRQAWLICRQVLGCLHPRQHEFVASSPIGHELLVSTGDPASCDMAGVHSVKACLAEAPDQ